MRLTCVVFDLYITLTDFDNERRRPVDASELAIVLGVDPQAFIEALRLTFGDRASGRMGDIAATLRTIAESIGGEPSEETLAKAVQLRRVQELRIAQPRAGVLEVLKELAALDVSIGLLSDCTPELGDLWPSLPYGEFLDAKLFSYELGLRKPAPDLYLELASRLGAAPAACMYVGDGSSGELTGAASVGMTPVLLETPFGDDFRYDAERSWSGLTVTSVSDVPQMLFEQNQC